MPDRAVSILLVEDNPGDARLFQEAIEEAHAPQFELVHRDSFGQALIYLAKKSPDVIVLDLGLPDANGIDAVQKMRAAAHAIPLVVLTGLNDEALAVRALQEGAQDYLIKGQLDCGQLSRALRYAMERHRMHAALQNESLIDELTNLYNRRGFLTLAAQHAKLAQRTSSNFLVVFVDLDGLKQINDTLGHQEGDRALVEAASVLRGSLRDSDILARLGGDEFAIVLPSTTENADGIIKRRFQQKLDLRNVQLGRRYKLSFSVGIVECTAEEQVSMEELLARADALMYTEKQNKKATREFVRPEG